MLEPGVEEEVATTETEAGDLGWRGQRQLLHLAGELGGWGGIVGIKGSGATDALKGSWKSCVAMGGVVVEDALG